MPNGQTYEDWIKERGPRGGWGEQRTFVTGSQNELPRKAE